MTFRMGKNEIENELTLINGNENALINLKAIPGEPQHVSGRAYR